MQEVLFDDSSSAGNSFPGKNALPEASSNLHSRGSIPHRGLCNSLRGLLI